MREVLATLDGWWHPLWVVGGAILLGLVLHLVLFAIARAIASRTDQPVDDMLVRYARGPAWLILPIIVVYVTLPGAGLPAEIELVVRRLANVGLILGIGWLAVAGLNLAAELVEHRFDVSEADNLLARRMHTQVRLMRRIGIVVVIFLTGAAILMTFPTLRNVGFSLFASAGVAGLVVGLAARPALSNLIAGIQIALTDTVRLDDVVIIEGEWGWIEKITTTHIVVRIWDLRRLVVPLSRFIEQPFQNWTLHSADILGTVHLYADYTVPVDAVRGELQRIVEGSEHWDGKVCGLQVTEANERTVELRALVSAATSPKVWNLRCEVRERLIAFLQENHPASLPRIRADLDGRGADPA